MAHATVTADLDQPLDVHIHFAAQIALDLVFAVNHFTQSVDPSSARSFTRVSGLIRVRARIFLLDVRPIP
jgi:hypothetical protein